MYFPDILSKKTIGKGVPLKEGSQLRKRSTWERGVRRQKDLKDYGGPRMTAVHQL